MDFAVLGEHRVKLKESEKKNKYLDLTSELKTTVEYEIDGYINCNWCSWYSYQKTGELGTKRRRVDHPNYCIIEIGQNTEKSPGDLWRLVVTQTPVRNLQLTLVWKNLKGGNNSNNLKKWREFAVLWILLFQRTTDWN